MKPVSLGGIVFTLLLVAAGWAVYPRVKEWREQQVAAAASAPAPTTATAAKPKAKTGARRSKGPSTIIKVEAPKPSTPADPDVSGAVLATVPSKPVVEDPNSIANPPATSKIPIRKKRDAQGGQPSVDRQPTDQSERQSEDGQSGSRASAGRTVFYTVVGAGAGGALGKAIGGKKGAVIGAVAGGATGAVIGAETRRKKGGGQ